MLDERWPEDVAELSAGLRSLLEKACRTDVVRAAEASADGRDPTLEEKLDGFGLWELPQSGAMLSAASWEIGRALAPIPFPECATVSGVLDIRGATCGIEGAVPVPPDQTVILDAAGAVRLAPVTARPRRTAAGDLLSEPPQAGAYPVVGEIEAGERLIALARLLHAARIAGAAERMLETGVEHAKQRTQFGKPIGSFQAVAQRLADAAIALDGATLLVRKAAWVHDETRGSGSTSWAFGVMAWAKAVDAGRAIASAVHQVMGGYGFTVEEDTQLYSRRIRSWTMRLPSPGGELARLARLLLDGARRDLIGHLWQFDEGIPLPRWATETDAG
ncbi:MAG: acyl-CoA dehydrogenase family protein [Actinomycetota bacterium]